MEVSLLGPWSLPLSILLCAQRVLIAEDCITRVSHLLDSVFSRSIGGTLQEGQGKRRKRIIHLFLISPDMSIESWQQLRHSTTTALLSNAVTPTVSALTGSAIIIFSPLSSFSPLSFLVLPVAGFLNILYPFNISTFEPTAKNSVLC